MRKNSSFAVLPDLKQYLLRTIDGRQIHVAEVGHGYHLIFAHVEQPELAMKFVNQSAQKWLI